MTITIDWGDDARQDMLLLRFTGEWDWLEFQAVVHETAALIQAQPHPVDVIFDLLPCPPFHRFDGIAHIWHALRQHRQLEPGYVVLISRDVNVRVLASVIRHSHACLQEHLLVVDSETDALAALNHYRG